MAKAQQPSAGQTSPDVREATGAHPGPSHPRERTLFAEERDAASICRYALQAELEAAELGVTTRCLQPVGKEICEKLKEGEAEKQKSYSAIIWAARALTPADLDTIRGVKDLVSNSYTNPKGLQGFDLFELSVSVSPQGLCSARRPLLRNRTVHTGAGLNSHAPRKGQPLARQTACKTDVITLSWPMARLRSELPSIRVLDK